MTRSSLIYYTSAIHERYKCNTSATLATRARHKWDKSNTTATQVRHECYTNDTSVTQIINERHEWTILILITTWVKTYLYTLISAIWQVKGYNEMNNFILRTTFWKCLFFILKCILKSALQKLNFLTEKAASRRCTLDCSYKCPCTFPHSYAQ